MSIVLIERARVHAGDVALSEGGTKHVYGELLEVSATRSAALGAAHGERVAMLVPPGFDFAASLWAAWGAGAIAVPLAVTHPAPELARILADADPRRLVVADSLLERAAEAVEIATTLRTRDASPGDEGGLERPQILTPAALDAEETPSKEADDPSAGGLDVAPSDPALMVYTSGTTGTPKGVVTTHANLEAQVTTLVNAWEWAQDDHILHVLPLHHVHGLVNALCCPLYAGAVCEFAPPDPATIWERFADGEVTVFMAVPTLYRRLIDAWEAAGEGDRRRWAAGAARLRLMVSGSAALPVETLQRWEEITGHRLLERYGMSEIGMALGNPLHGERRAGTVGQPFAGVEVRLIDDQGAAVAAGEQGQILVRGAQVFREYWRRPDETAAAFDDDGWFRTGDEAVLEDGYWRIVGRRSVDIIKTGGYKVSALEIEAVLRRHPDIGDAAVIGMPDEKWGERVCAALVADVDGVIDTEGVRGWCRQQLAPYKVPKQIAILTHLPRNAMGKVTKPALRSTFVATDAER